MTTHTTGTPPLGLARRAGNTAITIVLAGCAGFLAFSTLLWIIIRDVPSVTGMANGVVADVALALNVPNATEVSSQVVSQVDSSLLGGALSLADQIRLLIKFLPVIPIGVILLGWRLTSSGWPRRRVIGLTTGVFGIGLLLYTWLLASAATTAVSVLPADAERVGDRFVSQLFGPAWTIAWIASLGGVVLFFVARSALRSEAA